VTHWQPPPEDQPPGPVFIPASEDAAVTDAGQPFEAPAGTVMAFLGALADVGHYRVALRNLTTPESWPGWGDFSDAAGKLVAIGPNWGIQTRGQRPDP
jgi:hypothetical protein